MIRTERLVLIAVTPALLRADLTGRGALAEALEVDVPPSWPPDLFDEGAVRWALDRLERDPASEGWWTYYVTRAGADGEPETLVGVGGYKGPPGEAGTVEIGYAVLPEFRRRGYATEAARGLVLHAFTHPRVHRVTAETLPELTPSIGVLEKCGFTYDGPGSEDGVIRYALEQPAETGVGR